MSAESLNGYRGDGVSVSECQALRHLHADGYTTRELQMVLEYSQETVIRHLNAECGHPEVVLPGEAPEDAVEHIPPEQLRRARARAALSQTDVADALGVGKSAVSNWERGVARPRPERVPELREILPIEEQEE